MDDVTLRFKGTGLPIRNIERTEGRIWGEIDINGVAYVVKFLGDGEWVVFGPKAELDVMVARIEELNLTEREKALAVEPWSRCTHDRVM